MSKQAILSGAINLTIITECVYSGRHKIYIYYINIHVHRDVVDGIGVEKAGVHLQFNKHIYS